jgi:hypothetical protein
LIRNELMGHAPAAFGLSGAVLGMTAVYTHTRPETKRRQLEEALGKRRNRSRVGILDTIGEQSRPELPKKKRG